jgi:hypothetical protein
VGPRCSVAGPVPPAAPRRAAVVVSPSGVDADGCGSTRRPCASVRHALLVHFWEWAQRAEGEAAAEVVLLRGRYAGAANTALELHGVPLVLRGLEGASELTEIDCTREPGRQWGALFAAGEGANVTVHGLTLRMCLTESQMHGTLADHPQHAAQVAGAARWPAYRAGATFESNIWLSD